MMSSVIESKTESPHAEDGGAVTVFKKPSGDGVEVGCTCWQ
jgi:hypothetical protein